jgi:CspA family cold shock protein
VCGWRGPGNGSLRPYQSFPRFPVVGAPALGEGPNARAKCKEAGMATGKVKWFNATKGYGFIAPNEGGKDVFVHITAVEKAGLRGLQEGQSVSYDILTERGKTAAGNLKVV